MKHEGCCCGRRFFFFPPFQSYNFGRMRLAGGNLQRDDMSFLVPEVMC